MNSIPLSSLVPSTYFDQPVCLDKSYILLTPDSPVTPELVKRLQKWRYLQVYTDGRPKDVPGYLSGSGTANISPQTIDEGIQQNAQVVAAHKFHNEFSIFTANLFTQYNTDGVLNLATVTDWVKKNHPDGP